MTNLPGSLPPGVTYDALTQSFTLDPSNAAFQHLAAGDHTTVTVNYGVSDGIATTVLFEATLSFLGVGVPPTQPSLGTLIRIGNDFLFSGEWWITIFPGVALIAMVPSVTLLGDWLRDALNAKLR